MQQAFHFFRDTLHLADAQQPLTSYAGLMLPQQVMDDSGFMDQADERLPAAASNNCFASSEMLATTMLLHLVGGGGDGFPFLRDSERNRGIVPTPWFGVVGRSMVALSHIVWYNCHNSARS